MLLLEPVLFLLSLFICTLILEFFVQPKAGRPLRASGLLVHSLLISSVYGWLLLASGSPLFSASLTGAMTLALIIASNLKLAVLGEPLVFSDLSVVKDVMRHPKFYIFAIPVFIRLAVLIVLLCIPVGYIFSISHATPIQWRIFGLFLAFPAAMCLAKLPVTRLATTPALQADMARFGLLGCLFVYWRCWQKQSTALAPHPQTASPAFDLIVVVQCESFTDPKNLNLPPDVNIPSMPELEQARKMASDYGALSVSGFGAYTIRTEYGVLFGRSEEELGFQKFDPFLTAKHEKALSLSYKLGNAGFRSVFLHPYNLDFSNRRSLMAQIGFDTILGAETFPHIATPDMPYVSDKTLGDKIISLCSETPDPLFLYAVTIENHGPWKEKGTPLTSYLDHLKNSDQMIGDIIRALATGKRSALLVFFGDHRPSIPPALSPTTERSTPYFVIPFSKEKSDTRDATARTLTPAQLHALIENRSKINEI
jgi:hypothetical protein